jgi:hypothetical protein
MADKVLREIFYAVFTRARCDPDVECLPSISPSTFAIQLPTPSLPKDTYWGYHNLTYCVRPRGMKVMSAVAELIC